MRRYELMLLLRPDLEDANLQAAVEKVQRAIVNGGGSISKVSPWGKRRLAYDISRHREASYFLIHFDIEPAQVREIERGMLISEEILRHLVTVLEDRGPADEIAPAVAARQTDGDLDEGEAAPFPLDAIDVADDDVPPADEGVDVDPVIDADVDTTAVAAPDENPSEEDAPAAPADAERAGA
jgi:small subunit ribosomal protein S6